MARPRGRPPGITPQGEETRSRLYAIAIGLFAERGYDATTLRAVAREAGVSTGLLYRYFPSKQAVVLALYDELSHDFAARTDLPPGTWGTRFLVALSQSLDTLGPHRAVLAAVLPVLLVDGEGGLLSAASAHSRQRVRAVFVRVARDATPPPPSPEALGGVLYLAHLGVLLFWLLDRTDGQSATTELVALLRARAPLLELGAWVPGVPTFVDGLDTLARRALFGGGGRGAPSS